MIWVELHENEASRAKLRCLKMRYAVMPQNCCVPECKKKVYVESGVKISFRRFPEERKLFMKWIVAIRYIGKHFQVTTHTKSLLETFQAIGLSSFTCRA